MNLAEDAAHASHVANLRRELRRWHSEFDDTQMGQGEDFWAGFDALL